MPRYVEVTFRLDDAVVDERLREDIEAYNAQVELAAKAAPAHAWFAKLT